MRLSFRQLVEKVLHDTAFRHRLRRDPESALESVGVTPTPAMIRSLRAFNWRSAESVARAFHHHGKRGFIT